MSTALVLAALGLVAGLATALRYQLPTTPEGDLAPSRHWPEPVVVREPEPEQGPVLVTVRYRIDPGQAHEFARAMRVVRRQRRRDGAMRWGLFSDASDPRCYVECFLVESWAEHLRQHERVTEADRAVEAHALAFHSDPEPPSVSHLIAQPLPRE